MKQPIESKRGQLDVSNFKEPVHDSVTLVSFDYVKVEVVYCRINKVGGGTLDSDL
jgi:hypothetical protein